MSDTAIAGIVAIVFICYYFLKRDGRRKPPEAAGGWPVIGHLGILGVPQPHIRLGALADKYGPIFRIRIGVHPAVVVSSWELAKECFTTHDVIVSSRPKYTAAKILGHNYANFGFTPYGAFWREMRKITALELLSTRRFEMFQDVRDNEVHSFVKDIYRVWSNQRDRCSGEVLIMDVSRWLGETNLNVILRMIAGKRYSGEDEKRRCGKAFREMFRLTGLFVVGDAIPFLGCLDLGGHVKQMKKTAKEVDDVIGEWLKEHRQKRQNSDVLQTEQDFIDVLLSVLDQADLAGYDADTVIRGTCTTLIAGAMDTTTITMTWALSLLLNNPDALKKVQDELEEKVGKDRLVSESDTNKLVYLQAVVKETLRLYTPGPLSGARIFSQNCTLGGYHIAAGTRLITNLWKLHRDPRVWSEALEFRPERFLSTHKEIDVKGQHFELIPFGGGRRACPGIPFGLQMTLLGLAAFLQAYHVATPSNAPVDMGSTFGLTTVKTHPLQLLLNPRLPPSLYH